MTKRAFIVPFLVLVFAVLLLIGLRGGWTTWEGNHPDQTTDDATVRADVTPLSTRISGTVKQVNVSDFAAVKKGDCLVVLEDADYRAALDGAKAALDAAKADLAANQDGKRIQGDRIASARTAIAQSDAAIDAANAGVAAMQGDVLRADQEIARQRSLFAASAATRQQLEGATADANRFSGGLSARKADVARAEGAKAQAQATLAAEQAQRLSLDTHDRSYKAQIEARQAAIAAAEVNLAFTKICAPVDGTVGERHVQPGQLVAPGMQVIDLVSNDPWILANFKETQLKNIVPGDSADIQIDSLPGRTFHGRVLQLSPASGSQFALIPPDNATGNYTKIVQRIPVKIAIDPQEAANARILPGLSAVVTVHTSHGDAK